MSAVKRADTGPEKVLRSALHAGGIRYRLHDKTLPGTPDLVLPRFGAVIFVHGCYWHRHGCARSTIPSERRDFWIAKFAANRERDARKEAELKQIGWRVLCVWECALVGPSRMEVSELAAAVRRWLDGETQMKSLPARPSGGRRRA